VAVSRPLLLVYRPLGLGDLLCAVPALRALRDGFPGHRIVLCAPAALEPIARLSGAVDEVLDTAPLAVPALRGADLAVNLHGRGPQSHRAVLASEPRRMIAFAAPPVPWPPGPDTAGTAPFASGGGLDWSAGDQDVDRWSRHVLEWRAGEREVDRWCRLLTESGIPSDPSRLDLPRPAPAVGAVGGATVIHPGAASGARRWPAERWAAVARAERDAGRRVVVTGSAAERALAEAVAGDAGYVLAGRTDAAGLAAIVASAGRVFCGDTGVAHLATAFGTPSVVLFGPTPPSEWGPPPGRAQHVVLYRGGRGDPHADAPDPGLLEITVADVLAVTRDRFPAHTPGRPRAWESATRSQAASRRLPAT
jgi:ADP-heptose:LPS heptosyltransferase